jgi:transcriptional regulator with XRE-family HTH domain
MPRSPALLRPATAPAAVREAIEKLGANIMLARKNRNLRQEDLARKAGVTRRVIMRIEAGHLGVGIGTYAAVLWALGLDADLALLASPERDTEGQTLAAARYGSRVRNPSGPGDDF